MILLRKRFIDTVHIDLIVVELDIDELQSIGFGGSGSWEEVSYAAAVRKSSRHTLFGDPPSESGLRASTVLSSRQVTVDTCVFFTFGVTTSGEACRVSIDAPRVGLRVSSSRRKVICSSGDTRPAFGCFSMKRFSSLTL